MKPFSEFQIFMYICMGGSQVPLLRAGLWYLSALFLTLVCVIPIGMGCVPGGVGEADKGPLLRTGL